MTVQKLLVLVAFLLELAAALVALDILHFSNAVALIAAGLACYIIAGLV